MTFELDPLYVFYGFGAIAAVLVVEALYLLLHNKKDYRTRVNRRLSISGKEANREKVLVQLRRERGLSTDGGYRLPIQAFNRLVIQSGVKMQPARVALALALCGLIGFMGVFAWTGEPLYGLAAAALSAALIPLAVLLWRRKRRLKAFGTQFPEAIDIIVRSLRAGHPTPVAIAMVARELPDPVGTEFGMVADEITYGSDLEGALRAMMARTGHEDLPLFVTSVAIQATTGGNLSQILDNLAKVIRERFKMRRKIRGLAAEGRASAMILNAVPFVVFGIINWMSPSFYGAAWPHPMTKIALGGALAWMFVGNLIMRRMINFKF
ncbi:MAG TPA: type II secretion system F family protein [Beijerinckiaceae bacterium]|jgi:tight adherence protein B